MAKYVQYMSSSLCVQPIQIQKCRPGRGTEHTMAQRYEAGGLQTSVMMGGTESNLIPLQSPDTVRLLSPSLSFLHRLFSSRQRVCSYSVISRSVCDVTLVSQQPFVDRAHIHTCRISRYLVFKASLDSRQTS